MADMGGSISATDTLVGRLKCTTGAIYAAFDTTPTVSYDGYLNLNRFYVALVTAESPVGTPTTINQLYDQSGSHVAVYAAAHQAYDALWRKAVSVERPL